ncbi:MAG: hypothetical protein ACI4O9_05265, partial [Akkermansia sp.]
MSGESAVRIRWHSAEAFERRQALAQMTTPPMPPSVPMPSLMPPVTHPIIPDKPTRPKEPKAYSSLALTFIRLILEAEKDGLPYLIIFEDDAYPCAAPQETLDKLLAEHPLPADCGLLCLGDANGVIRFRGRHTILLDSCQRSYTSLVPNRAENKGSHAFVLFRSAMIPFVQVIASFGVTDMSFSRIRNHGDLRAYGIFFDPIFTQHRFNGGNAPEPAHRFPEYFLHHKAELDKRFPRPTQQSRLLAKSSPRFWLFANHPKANAAALEIAPDDVLVFLNRAKPYEHLKVLPNRKLLIVRRNARDKNWFIPYGKEQEIFGSTPIFVVYEKSSSVAT